MELVEFRKDYLENVKMLAAADSVGTVASFVRTVLDDLQDLNVISDFEECFDVGKYGRKTYRVDAYSFDDYDCSMSIFIADFDGDDDSTTLTMTDAKTLFEKTYTFLDGSLNGNFRHEMEISTPAYDLVDRIVNLENTIRKYRFFVVTDKSMSGKISNLSQGNINGVPIEYNIWDMQRLYRVMTTGDGHEPVEIDFLNLTESGLPCLEASDASTDDVKCLLCVIPGQVLADLYDTYGSALLEGNVRSFLSAKGNVNKNIRKTILEADGESKKMFFSYNNGISATATSVETKIEQGGSYVTSINNLQIVNGGQTTASLSNTRFKDKADLSGIFVQMKLTVIPDHEQAQILIPKISRGSNSQNKVSDADFFSNHEFNIRMQQISRRIYAPAVNGLQYETHWFFERSRGQYEQEQGKMTQSEKKKYQMMNPKEQKITKTDIAKYQNTWRQYPYFVSLGAQKNFTKFANFIVDEWDKDDVQFNEQFYRNTVVVAILFKCIDKLVPKQNWYEKGYKANIVVYTLSFFHFLVRKTYPDHELNMRYIWDKQSVPEPIYDELVKMAEFVFLHITDENRPITNVTEWCKKEQCWIALKVKDYVLDDRIKDFLLDKDEIKKEKSSGRREHVVVNGIQVQAEVVSRGQEYWENALLWGKDRKLLNEIETSFLSAATKMNMGRIPSEKQCQRIVNIEAKLLDEGFSGKR
ncbi:MAG TPA: AIPR family protein [Lachnospiraceae bacterium]|nr:AIPR family protein [Lachnospiraceae bacterium]